MKSVASNAKSAEGELDDYSDVISKRIIKKLGSLPGNDAKGYIAAAIDAASNKSLQLGKKKPQFSSFSSDVSSLYNAAQEADSNVSKRISQLTEPYKSDWSFSSAVRSVTGFFYNVFCVDVAGFISDHIPYGEVFVNTIKKGYNSYSHWRDDVVDYFTHGDGQYIKTIVSSALKVVGAAIAVCVAATAGSVVLAVIGIIAGGIYLLYSMGNFMATTQSNVTAFEQARNSNPGLAHYYGGVGGVSDWVKKTDLGDADTNIRAEAYSEIYDTVGKTSKVVLDIVMIAIAVDNLFEVHSTVQSNKDYKGSFENFKKSLTEEQLKDPKVQQYLEMRQGKVYSTQVEHQYTWENFKSNFTRKRYQTVIDAGEKFKYSTKGSSNLPVTEPNGHGINVGKLLFKKESKMISNLGSSDPVKSAKGKKAAFEMVYNLFTSDKGKTMTNAETIDDFISSPDKYDIGKFVSSIIDMLGLGGISEITGTYVEPFTNWGKDMFDLAKHGHKLRTAN